MRRGLTLIAVIVFAAGCETKPAPQLTQAHRHAIDSAIRKAGFQQPQSVEISDLRFLVVTFEISGPMSEASLRAFAEKATVVIRNAMQPYGIVNAYRVTLNGPSPGPGLITRYGDVRFMEGGSVQWEPAR